MSARRYYTFIWTAKLHEACAEMGIKMVILDRPNPINGIHLEGPVLNKEFRSFVGLFEIPIRHGMTIGELMTMINDRENIGCRLEVIKMRGWNRNMWFEDTGLPWVLPSPNMPAVDTAVVYPGGCLLEATNLSEGRGTTRPFELFGAGFIDADRLVEHMNRKNLPGVLFRMTYFQPTFNKFSGKVCGGFQMHVINREAFRPVKTTVLFIEVVKRLYPDLFAWKNPPYEYEFKKMPIDILWGDSSLRETIDSASDGIRMKELEDKAKSDLEKFSALRKDYLIYEPFGMDIF